MNTLTEKELIKMEKEEKREKKKRKNLNMEA